MPTTKPTAKPAAKTPRKPKAQAVKKTEVKEEKVSAAVHHAVHKAEKPSGKYIFATGRRKTAVSNIRLFEGHGETLVNKMPLKKYFHYSFYHDEVSKPLEVTGLAGKYHFVAHINGGGPHSQAQALRHGLSVALSQISSEVRLVLKKNGFLTRDDRRKERKKPGLKRARRSPQWAKR